MRDGFGWLSIKADMVTGILHCGYGYSPSWDGWERTFINLKMQDESKGRGQHRGKKKEGYHDGRKAYRWEGWVARAPSVVMVVMMVVLVVARRRSLLLAGRGRSRGGTGGA